MEKQIGARVRRVETAGHGLARRAADRAWAGTLHLIDRLDQRPPGSFVNDRMAVGVKLRLFELVHPDAEDQPVGGEPLTFGSNETVGETLRSRGPMAAMKARAGAT